MAAPVSLATCVPAHGRAELTIAALQSLWELRRCMYESEDRVSLYVYVVTDCPRTLDLASSWYGFSLVDFPNDDLISKLNACRESIGKEIEALQPDGILGLGSDDFIDANYIRAAADACRRGVDFWGVRDGYFYDEPTGRMIHWPGYTGEREGEPIGPGRMLSRRYHELCGWKPWGDTPDRYTDRAMMRVLDGLRDQVTVETTSLGAIDAMLCDVKTHENLTPFSAMLASPGIREANQGERERFLRLYEATTTTE